jgi:preprotein translocase subunit SecA
MTEVLLPIIKDVHQHEGHKYKRIAVPFTDGRSKALGIAADLEEAINSNGKTIMRDIEKAVTLSLIDDEWKEHLRDMDELKDSVQGASFEQKDPLVLYKLEAFQLFENFIARINKDVTSYLSKGMLMIEAEKPVREAKVQKTDFSKQMTNRVEEPQPTRSQQQARAAAEGVSERPKIQTIMRDDPKIGRNDPCPCGSGKKYKQCHGS